MNQKMTIPRFRLPQFVASLGQKLPQWPHSLVLTGALNAALKLKLLPESELALLEAGVIRKVHQVRAGVLRAIQRAIGEVRRQRAAM